MKKKGKPKFDDYMYDLNCYHLLPDMQRFIKILVFHIGLEMLITVYLLEMFGFFTKYFLVTPFTRNNVLLLMLIPLVIVVPLTLVFSVAGVSFAVKSIGTILNVTNDTSRTKATTKQAIPVQTEDNLYNTYKKPYIHDIRKAHFLGILCYFVFASLSALAVVLLFRDSFIHKKILVLLSAGIGGLLGILWNMIGLNRTKRICWGILFAKMGKFPVPNHCIYQDAKGNLSSIRKNIAWDILALLIVASFVGFIILSLHSAIQINFDLLDSNSGYGIFFVYFTSLILFYIRREYKMNFQSEDDSSVCSTTSTLLNYMQKWKEEEKNKQRNTSVQNKTSKRVK